MKYLTVLLLILLPVLSFSQSETTSLPEIDERLYKVFDAEYLERLQTKNPFIIQRWNFYLQHAFYIAEDTKAKKTSYPVIEIDDLEHLNILTLEKEQALKRDLKKEMAYQIKGTNKVLVYHSIKKFNEKLNKHLERTQ